MKNFSEMTVEELQRESAAWYAIITAPKGPGTPNNVARSGAERLEEEVQAWIARKVMEA